MGALAGPWLLPGNQTGRGSREAQEAASGAENTRGDVSGQVPGLRRAPRTCLNPGATIPYAAWWFPAGGPSLPPAPQAVWPTQGPQHLSLGRGKTQGGVPVPCFPSENQDKLTLSVEDREA